MTRTYFLRDLAERLRRVPAMYGVDDYHIDVLHCLASDLDAEGVGQKPAPLSLDADIEDMLS